jgi:hypothetical protein
VLTVTFVSARPPSKKMQITFDGGGVVEFEQQ